jgi:hypothetical protein
MFLPSDGEEGASIFLPSDEVQPRFGASQERT